MTEFTPALPIEGATNLLRKWDNYKPITTIEMGGLGKGYELALQSYMFEIIRAIIKGKYNTEDFEGDKWLTTREKLYKEAKMIDGLSGAQAGAAMGLASHFCLQGLKSLQDPQLKSRIITLSKARGDMGVVDGE